MTHATAKRAEVDHSHTGEKVLHHDSIHSTTDVDRDAASSHDRPSSPPTERSPDTEVQQPPSNGQLPSTDTQTTLQVSTISEDVPASNDASTVISLNTSNSTTAPVPQATVQLQTDEVQVQSTDTQSISQESAGVNEGDSPSNASTVISADSSTSTTDPSLDATVQLKPSDGPLTSSGTDRTRPESTRSDSPSNQTTSRNVALVMQVPPASDGSTLQGTITSDGSLADSTSRTPKPDASPDAVTAPDLDGTVPPQAADVRLPATGTTATVQGNTSANHPATNSSHSALNPSSTPESTDGPAPAAAGRAARAHELNLASGQESSRSHADNDANLRPSPSNVSALVSGKGRSQESSAVPDSVGRLSDQQDRPLQNVTIESDSKSASAALAHQRASHELFSVGLPMVAPEQAPSVGAQTSDLEVVSEFVEDPLSGPALSIGLLGSPLQFDLDSLVQEAEQFFAQVDQLGQDLASMLGRVNLLSGAIAIGVTATGAAIARRRFQQSHHGLVLQGCAGEAFTGYPGLGGPRTWDES